MNDEQRVRSVAAIVAATRLFHTQGALASIIGKSQGHVSRLVAGDAEIDAVDAVTIDQRSSGKIPRHELRPDLWDAPRRARSLDRFADAPQRMLDVVRQGRITLDGGRSYLPGDRLKISGTKIFDGEHVVGAVLDKLTPPTKGQTNGKTRTGKREGKEKASGPEGRPRTQGRQGRKA